MIKRTLHFSNPAYLSLQNQQLHIRFPGAENLLPPRQIPVEDIGVVILSHQQITITQACLCSLLQHNAVILTCNAAHMPTGLMLPMEGNTTQSERFKYQIMASQPLKKALWQQTIQAKILNQAAILSQRGIHHANMLHWAKNVRSGDPDNFEARAAAYYWQNVFPPKVTFFRQREGNPPNNLLNYGYAILRAIVARALVCAGLLPTLGIFHKSKYNAYCLADDIMEPYRPYVDAIVLKIVDNGENFLELGNNIKKQLLGIAGTDVYFTKGRSPLLVGVQHTAASLARCFQGTQRKIIYPALCNYNGKVLSPLSPAQLEAEIPLSEYDYI